MFDIYKDKTGKKFYFRLKAKNGQVILTSQAYDSRKSCENGIASVQKNGGNQARFEEKTAKNGKCYFNLLAANKQVIGTSQMYATQTSMRKGIASVIANAENSAVKDLVERAAA